MKGAGSRQQAAGSETATRADTPQEAVLRQLVALNDGRFCERCRCCEMTWEECEACGGEGLDGHDCGEDCCCCADPEPNECCDYCLGAGGWWDCDCDEHGVHRPKAAVEVAR